MTSYSKLDTTMTDFKVFDYKEAENVENRVCNGNFWAKKAEERANLELDYHRRLCDWCGSYKNMDLKQDCMSLESMQVSLWQKDLDVSSTRVSLALETGKLYEKLSEDLKTEKIASVDSISYTSILPKYKNALKAYEIKLKETRKAKQKYDSKLRSLSAHEAAYRPNFHTIDGKISKMRASVDIAKRLYEYCQLQEISARAHLIQASHEIRLIWQLQVDQKLVNIVEKWKKCIASVQESTKSIMKNADYSVMAMQDIEKAKLHVALELETDQLVMTVGSPEVEEDIGLENNACTGTPLKRAGSQISVITERSCPSVFGSDTESVEEIQFDYSKLCDSDKSHYIINFPHKFGFRTSVSNGWLRGLQEGESVSQSDLKANKGYGFKVEVIREYEKRNDREISLKSGQHLRQMFPPNETGYAFGYKRNKFHRRCFGYFPASHVKHV